MNIFRRLWRAISKMFNRTKTGSALATVNVKPAVNGEMVDRMTIWDDMWKGRAYWVNPKKGVESLHIERDIARDFSNTAVSEMTVQISDTVLDEIFNKSIRNLSEELQEGLASGALVVKPLGGDRVQYISQFDFIPIEYDSEKRLTAVIFPDCRKQGDTYYTRLEYHNLTGGVLTIQNRAYASKSENELGREVALDVIDDWAELPELVSYAIGRPLYGYYRNPIKNTIDDSLVGVSIYDTAVNKIKRADIQAGRLDWEFESAERKIHVDEQAIQLTSAGASVLDKRLYKGLNLMQAGDELYKEYSPTLRQADFLEGLDEIKREIEFSVGLAYGDLSNVQDVAHTATEILTSKKRKYDTVKAIQENLTDCLEDLCFALAFYNEKATSGYEFNCTFRDSITVDDETRREQDRRDVSMGVMPAWEYRTKWYGETEEEARRMTDEASARVLE